MAVLPSGEAIALAKIFNAFALRVAIDRHFV
jgi:hypothetical protein